MIPSGIELMCAGCEKPPAELGEYVAHATEEGISPEEYVWREEGTLNPETGLFLCDICYVAKGSPATPQGWMA